MYDTAEDDDKMLAIYCGFCGSKLGKLEQNHKGVFHCPKCREYLITVLKEGSVTFTHSKRENRPVPVKA